MTTKITVIYDNPADPIAFESGYAPVQVDLAKKLPGLQRIETSKVWPKEDGSPTPLYRMVDLYFSDYESASAAVTTQEAAALFPSILGLATGGVRIAFSDIEESSPPLRASLPCCMSRAIAVRRIPGAGRRGGPLHGRCPASVGHRPGQQVLAFPQAARPCRFSPAAG